MPFNLWVEAFFKAAIVICALHPFGNCEGVLLVGRPFFDWKRFVPKRGIDLRDHRPIWWNAPAVERPEMDSIFYALPDVSQPWDSCVRGLRYRTLHVELKHGFGGACTQFGQATPAGMACAGD
jgi:hypothetical protein